jgi:hypothetical protein
MIGVFRRKNQCTKDMESQLDLRAAIDQIGTELVNCGADCAGIHRNREAGILPRCLILERGESSGRGCVAIGLNPGRSPEAERHFYVRFGCTYESVKDYWHSHVAKIQYYVKARRLIEQLGLDGPILWSDLAKCENAAESKVPPLQTLRQCSGRFLSQELEAAPSEWPIVALGWEAYRALAYLVPRRAVVGIPHPTGSWGAFSQMFEDGSIRPGLRERAVTAMSGVPPKAVWLGQIKDGA